MHQRSCAIHKRLKLSVEIENGNETANLAPQLDSTPPEDKQQSHSKNATQEFPSTNATDQPSSNSTLQQLLPNIVMQQFPPTNATKQISSTNAMQHHSSNNAAQQISANNATQQVPLTNDMQQPSPSNNMQEFSPTNALLQSQSTKIIQQLPSTNAIQRFSPTNAMQQPSLANTMQQFSSTNASQESPPTKPLKTDNWAPSSDKTAMPLARVKLPKSHAQCTSSSWELKHLKHDNHHFDAEIGLVIKLLRSKLALKQSANAKKQDTTSQLRHRFWWYCKKLFTPAECQSPQFNSTTCHNYFSTVLNEYSHNKHQLPGWLEKLPPPSKPCNTNPPGYNEISSIIRKYRTRSSPCPLDQISIIPFKKCLILRTILQQLLRIARGRYSNFPACKPLKFAHRTLCHNNPSQLIC
ncbi:hypothetical protein HELRODRAFT_167947 [Helobdella robusta]|uniref:Uncharacterized protein n=1 Tax=Helobdella robusta TaxID=6412 RepID=T1F000_HELRO|nr:hypothetical protein HELRODRAFT_167947 [Helobdella robusta]ESO10095.1 hypothetical protein HELRODRAFT_167947 [Helobdella robusta]